MATPTAEPPPSAPALFLGFLMLGLTSFGGALPFARRMLVEQRRWLSDSEFTHLLGLCQFLPGGNVINLSVAVGLQFRGVRGACAALFGLIAAPTLVVVGLGILYNRYQNNLLLQHAFAGLAAAAAGLLIAMAIKVAKPLRGKPLLIGIALVCFGAVALLRLPLLATMLTLAPISILLAGKIHR